MFVIQNMFNALAEIIHLAITLYMYAVIARVIVSWININPYNSFVRFLIQITEPVLSKIRRYMPDLVGVDISPMILIFILIFIDRFVVSTLRQMAF